MDLLSLVLVCCNNFVMNVLHVSVSNAETTMVNVPRLDAGVVIV